MVHYVISEWIEALFFVVITRVLLFVVVGLVIVVALVSRLHVSSSTVSSSSSTASSCLALVLFFVVRLLGEASSISSLVSVTAFITRSWIGSWLFVVPRRALHMLSFCWVESSSSSKLGFSREVSWVLLSLRPIVASSSSSVITSVISSVGSISGGATREASVASVLTGRSSTANRRLTWFLFLEGLDFVLSERGLISVMMGVERILGQNDDEHRECPGALYSVEALFYGLVFFLHLEGLDLVELMESFESSLDKFGSLDGFEDGVAKCLDDNASVILPEVLMSVSKIWENSDILGLDTDLVLIRWSFPLPDDLPIFFHNNNNNILQPSFAS